MQALCFSVSGYETQIQHKSKFSNFSGIAWLVIFLCYCRAMSKVQKIATEQNLQEVDNSRRIVKKEFLNQLISKIKGRDISTEEEQWTKALETEASVTCPSKVNTS